VSTEDGLLRVDAPRDRNSSFEPLLNPKHERRFIGFDDKNIAMQPQLTVFARDRMKA
jgi:transposase-like protein